MFYILYPVTRQSTFLGMLYYIGYQERNLAVFFFIHVQFLSSRTIKSDTYKVFDRSHQTEPEIILPELSTKKFARTKSYKFFFACHFHRLSKSFKFLRRQKIITFYV